MSVRTRRLPALVAALVVAVVAPVVAAPGDHDAVRDMSWPLGRVVEFTDTYDAARGGNADGCTNGRVHQAVDLVAPKMTEVHAAMGGRVVFLPETQPSYGWIIIIEGDDGLEYSYVHLNNDNPGTDDGEGGIDQAIVPGVRRGTVVERGQHIGWVGDSGSAESTAAHLHLDVEDPSLDDAELQCPYEGDRVNPYPSMVAALERGDVPGAITPMGSAGTSGDGEGSLGAPAPEEDEENPPVPDGWTWADVDPSGTHAGAIEALTEGGVVDGCSETRYCPTDALSRRDMARWLAAALDLEPVPADFDDVPADDPDAGWIGAIAARGITTGCTAHDYCPDGTVTRGQMATFLAVAYDLEPAEPDFDDVPDDAVHRDGIGAIVADGITVGCGDGASYCGDQDVTRGQLATFLSRA